jgi:trehalose 6-phosphate phosphatase
MECSAQWTRERLAGADRVWLFLDYDGTLADFAPTPDHVEPDPELIQLIERLSEQPCMRVTIVSGRRLDHVARLVPVPGILLAGSYGIELQTPDGERASRVAYEAIRPTLDDLKPRWAGLIADQQGFYLEDKGWALALHARFADDQRARTVLGAARHVAEQEIPGDLFRLLGGHKFLEVGPNLAHKGKTVDFLLKEETEFRGLPVYVGDDDKDEEAFGVIKAHGGVAVLVSHEPRETGADCRVESPQAARRWLRMLLSFFDTRQAPNRGKRRFQGNV